MTEFKINQETKMVLVLENSTCRMLNATDKDPKVVFVPLPEGGYKALSEVLWQGDGDDLSPECKLLIESIDMLLDSAYKLGFTQGCRLVKFKNVGRDGAGRRLGVKMLGGKLQV